MTAKIIKPKCLLLDANIIIKAYELEIWLPLILRVDTVVPSTVVANEALFYTRKTGGIPEEINLRTLIGEGRITEKVATIDELNDLYHLFDRVFIEGLHIGESEALALLYAGKVPEVYFCTGDAIAIKALAMLRMSDRGIAMEEVLGAFGLQRKLEKQYTTAFFQENIKRGQENLITGQGLSRGYL
ncbi:hypothetical protein M1O17_03965 [Dehalococcoidia bacterium]|nr:hypothetical protein [Dehalococcoidia bacterium]MCL0076004.1 hypothetical protein [Dehalococcoidia bacterium]MCL0102876.1 hypothetical protein [Dehalococcoidia bacterium]